MEPVEPARDLGEVWQYGEENLVEGGGVEQTVADGEQMEKEMEETGEEQVGFERLGDGDVEEGEDEGEVFEEEEDGNLFEESDREREGAKSCLGMIWPG